MRKFTVYDFNRSFPDDDACLDFIRDLLYPDGITCRSCGRVTKHHRLTKRKAFSCQECGTHIYPLAGTIFAKSSTRLKSWFYAMYLMASTRCGISAKQLERELGVTYKTAWRMFKQIRTLMGEQLEPFSGEIEIDETYIGGKPRLGQIRSRTEAGKWIERKTSVMGILERGGKVAALIVPDSRKKTMHPIIRERVLPESLIYTDEFKTYRGLGKQGFTHKRVNHSEKVYVAGEAHVNSIEGFFSLLKRGIGGVYHSVSSKHLQDYVNEYSFRFNHRADDEAMYDSLAGRVRKVRYGSYGTYHPIA